MSSIRFEDQQIARELRREGWTLPEIANELSAGKGLVSLWVRDVQIRKSGIDRLGTRKSLSKAPQIARDAQSKKCKAIRDEYRDQGRILARKGEMLHALACALYWAEGTKTRNFAIIVNTDMHILRTFMNFCRHYFDVKNSDVSIVVSGYTSIYSEKAMVNYWIEALDLYGVSERQHDFDSTKYASRGHNKAKIGKHPYGSCKIFIKKSTHIIQHIYGAIEVYGGAVLDPSRRPKGIAK